MTFFVAFDERLSHIFTNLHIVEGRAELCIVYSPRTCFRLASWPKDGREMGHQLSTVAGDR
jgi:hypothetical protein